MGFLKTSGIKRNKAYGKKLWQKGMKAIKKRYVRPAGLRQAIKDIAMVKRMVNAEKKRHTVLNYTPVAIGQCSGNNSAHYALDITPNPSQNATYSGRSGSSIKLSAMCMKFQFYQQSAAATPIKFRWYIMRAKGQSVTTAIVPSWFNSNQWIQASSSVSIYDTHSQFNPDYFGSYNVIRSGSFALPLDNLSGQTTIKDLTIKHRFKNHHVRFYGDTNNVVDGQLIFVIFADTGNCSTTTASTLTPVVNQAINTGATFVSDIRTYYYDN